MEAISYVNIFETKGIEYLLVLSFLIGFVLFVRMVRPAATRIQSPVVGLGPDPSAGDLECPAGPLCPFMGPGSDDDPDDKAAAEQGAA